MSGGTHLAWPVYGITFGLYFLARLDDITLQGKPHQSSQHADVHIVQQRRGLGRHKGCTQLAEGHRAETQLPGEGPQDGVRGCSLPCSSLQLSACLRAP